MPLVTAAVFQLRLYGAVASWVPRFTPSTRNCTAETPTSSDAVAVTVIVALTDALLLGAVTVTAGGVVSAAMTSAGGSAETRKSANRDSRSLRVMRGNSVDGMQRSDTGILRANV